MMPLDKISGLVGCTIFVGIALVLLGSAGNSALVGLFGGLIGLSIYFGFLSMPKKDEAMARAALALRQTSRDDRSESKKFRVALANDRFSARDLTRTRKLVVDVDDREKPKVERFIDRVLAEKPARFSSQMLEIFTSNYSSKLGEGGYGAVYKGHFSSGEQIAVKVLNSYGIDDRVEDQFMAEVNTIGRTYHRNLVRLYGFCFEENTKALVYEYMENGSLDKLLFEKKHEIEWGSLYEIAIGAARGLEYLHHFSHRRIIHYDIKPANILLDSNFCPKIADFGFAKLCSRDSTNIIMSKAGGTPGYAAPEVWMPFPVSYKCDVYGFGVMLFEIIGRRRNFDANFGVSQEWFPKQVWENFDKGELELVWDNCGIKEKDRKKAKTMATVALWCVQYLPESRPSMTDVVKILGGGAEAATPMNPFQHLISSANVPSCMVNTSNSTSDYDDDDRDDTAIMRKYEIQFATS
ncbi:hypothetical protein DITRI_Ditri08aG0071400 [Diplodiscus trichospermus]